MWNFRELAQGIQKRGVRKKETGCSLMEKTDSFSVFVQKL
ncbi:hypothetical protein RUMHYD_01284 [Blautia hydrogenotrophica DSM 10507]|uniref:Uncharacterized protein n=1 Tax=Blautia hydrogenotrophica (strain DSM 10507 / JCM 14656 / S5a33) TaxID=476272 RepID=C0CKB4_BLAHS|nr:hypothetical protein RUMHYD_01284 [Blautia hydrogenotrophica DSM 10507]